MSAAPKREGGACRQTCHISSSTQTPCGIVPMLCLICFPTIFLRNCSHQLCTELSSWKWQTRKFWLKHPLSRLFSVTHGLHQSVKLCYEKSFHFVEDFDIAKSGFISNWNETQISTFFHERENPWVTAFLAGCWTREGAGNPQSLIPGLSMWLAGLGPVSLKTIVSPIFPGSCKVTNWWFNSSFPSSPQGDLWRAWCCSPSLPPPCVSWSSLLHLFASCLWISRCIPKVQTLSEHPLMRTGTLVFSWPWYSVGVLELNAKIMRKNFVADLALVPTQIFSQSELDLCVVVCSCWCRSWDWSQVSETPWWLNQTLSQSTSSVDILAGCLLRDTW